MPTTDERREVAARLRDMAACGCLDTDDFGLLIKRAFRATVTVPRTDRAFLLSIADLIEPEERTCRNISLKAHKGVFCCSECEIHVDIALMDSIDDYLPSFCPNCGCRVID